MRTPPVATSARAPRVATSAQPVEPAEALDLLAGLPEPTPELVLAARKAVGHSQQQAALLAGLGHGQRWYEIERGKAPMDRMRWAMYLLAIGEHPALRVVRR